MTTPRPVPVRKPSVLNDTKETQNLGTLQQLFSKAQQNKAVDLSKLTHLTAVIAQGTRALLSEHVFAQRKLAEALHKVEPFLVEMENQSKLTEEAKAELAKVKVTLGQQMQELESRLTSETTQSKKLQSELEVAQRKNAELEEKLKAAVKRAAELEKLKEESDQKLRTTKEESDRKFKTAQEENERQFRNAQEDSERKLKNAQADTNLAMTEITKQKQEATKKEQEFKELQDKFTQVNLALAQSTMAARANGNGLNTSFAPHSTHFKPQNAALNQTQSLDQTMALNQSFYPDTVTPTMSPLYYLNDLKNLFGIELIQLLFVCESIHRNLIKKSSRPEKAKLYNPENGVLLEKLFYLFLMTYVDVSIEEKMSAHDRLAHLLTQDEFKPFREMNFLPQVEKFKITVKGNKLQLLEGLYNAYAKGKILLDSSAKPDFVGQCATQIKPLLDAEKQKPKSKQSQSNGVAQAAVKQASGTTLRK